MTVREFPFVGAVVAAALLSATALAGGECCDKAKAADGWCGACKVGYFAGVSIKNHALHNALAGTEVTKEAIADAKCAGCKEAYAKNGACPECKVTYANGRMYHSAAAAKLAMGSPIDAKALCKECQEHAAKAGKEEMAKGAGWCDGCKAGFVHGRMYKDKAAYEQANNAYTLVTKAASTTCEGCAVAMVTDGTCKECKVSYKGGVAQQP